MHMQGEWFCQACVERGHQPKVKQGSPPKPRKVKAPKSASGSGKSAGPKKGSGTAKKSALSLGLAKSRPATGMNLLDLVNHSHSDMSLCVS